jgi:hypothetical protein
MATPPRIEAPVKPGDPARVIEILAQVIARLAVKQTGVESACGSKKVA